MTKLDQAAGRQVPQPLALRPSAPTGLPALSPEGRPDELMIDWGHAPAGSEATLYWPSVRAIDVVRLGALFYPQNPLSVADPHTVRIVLNSRLSFVPIPVGAKSMLPGLFTLSLPPEGRNDDVRKDATYEIVVRRVRTTRLAGSNLDGGAQVLKGTPGSVSRHIVGTFQVTIPTAPTKDLLPAEENALAILKWRLQQTPPAGRWRTVLERFIEITAGRVDAFGGHAASIAPSPEGAPPPADGAKTRDFTGKVVEVMYDGFGDFEGFVLETLTGVHRFETRAPAIGDLAFRVCRETLTLTVITGPDWRRILNLVVRG